MWTTDTDGTVVLLCNTSGDTITREGVGKSFPGRRYHPPTNE